MSELKLVIEGMSCGHCVRHVTAALSGTPGVTVRAVEIGSALVDYDPQAATPEAIAQAVTDAGYPARAA